MTREKCKKILRKQVLLSTKIVNLSVASYLDSIRLESTGWEPHAVILFGFRMLALQPILKTAGSVCRRKTRNDRIPPVSCRCGNFLEPSIGIVPETAVVSWNRLRVQKLAGTKLKTEPGTGARTLLLEFAGNLSDSAVSRRTSSIWNLPLLIWAIFHHLFYCSPDLAFSSCTPRSFFNGSLSLFLNLQSISNYWGWTRKS